MKKMKPKPELFSYIIFVVTNCLIHSCSPNVQDVTLTKAENSFVAIEMYTHSTTIDQIEYLQAGFHDEYLHPTIIAQLKNDNFLRKKLNTPTLEINDTIFSYDEIPMVRESKSRTCILQDGSWQSSTEHLTPFETNVIYQLINNTPSEESRIFKTEVKDGSIKVYNCVGELIAEDVFPMMNMKVFLDTMAVYVRSTKKNVEKKAHDVAHMIRKLEQQLPESSKVSQLANSHVLLTCELKVIPSIVNKGIRTSGVIISRTEFNADMTKTLKFELFQEDFLIQRKTYSYNEKPTLCNFYHENIVSENPATIESETLVLNSKGFPVLHHTKENFQRNQTFYYFKE